MNACIYYITRTNPKNKQSCKPIDNVEKVKTKNLDERFGFFSFFLKSFHSYFQSMWAPISSFNINIAISL